MIIACLDLEGVLVPEIWVSIAECTGIDALRTTTRDTPNYNELMQQRLRILDENQFSLPDILAVIAEMRPLDGAKEFLEWLKPEFQVVILSDTFYEFAVPLMRQLDYPTLFCHQLDIDPNSRKIISYHLRQKNPKCAGVKAFHSLNFNVVAAGDSYNDITMLDEADAGILFCPSHNIIDEFPQFPVTWNYEELMSAFATAAERFSA